MIRRILFTLTFALIFAFAPFTVHAAPKVPNGMSVSPSRYELVMKAGETKKIPTAVTNNTTKAMIVNLSYKQFEVHADKRATRFIPAEYAWVTLTSPVITLQPNTSSTGDFTLSVPNDAAEGEYYFALMSETEVEDKESTKTLQLASLVYVYVDGGNMKRQAHLENTVSPRIVFGSAIPYEFDVKNTGNIHMRAEGTGKLLDHTDTSASQMVMPGQSRHYTGIISAPFWPGIYELRYGAVDQTTKRSFDTSTQVIYLPPWSLAGLVLVILASVFLWQRRH